jgi:hypothetical protein
MKKLSAPKLHIWSAIELIWWFHSWLLANKKPWIFLKKKIILFIFLKINPARLGKDENAVGNLTSLIEFLDEALDSIIHSCDHCPL